MKPGQTEYGKGSFNRSEFKNFQQHFDEIDFGHPKPYYVDPQGWFIERGGKKYGPFNTRVLALSVLKSE